MSIIARPPGRTAFFVSDHTGITIEMLGHSLLRQFENLPFTEITLPYLDTAEKALAVVAQINERAILDGVRPLLLSTFVNPEIRSIFNSANGLHLDCFNTFIVPLEAELGVCSSHAVGLSHRVGDGMDYRQRIEAVRYTLEHDDGVSQKNWQQADIILVGVSRSGKTPTCLYLALQYGICAANYPLIPEDLATGGCHPNLRVCVPSFLALLPILYGCIRYATSASPTASIHLLRIADMKCTKPKLLCTRRESPTSMQPTSPLRSWQPPCCIRQK